MSKSKSSDILISSKIFPKYDINISYYAIMHLSDHILNEKMKTFNKEIELYNTDFSGWTKYGRIRTYKYTNVTLDILKKIYQQFKSSSIPQNPIFFISQISQNSQPIFDLFNKITNNKITNKKIINNKTNKTIETNNNETEMNKLLENFEKLHLRAIEKQKESFTKLKTEKHNRYVAYFKKLITNTKYLDKLPTNTNSFIPSNINKSKSYTYITENNGGKSYKIVANSSGISVYKKSNKNHQDDKDNKRNDDEDNDDRNYFNPANYTQLIINFNNNKYQGFWCGYDTSEKHQHGNSILIKIHDNQYIFVGNYIYSFSTKDKIIDYISYLGNNDVPYPVAYGEENTYFMVDNKYVANSKLELDKTLQNAEHIYKEFYGGTVGSKIIDDKHKIKMKNLKIILKRSD